MTVTIMKMYLHLA